MAEKQDHEDDIEEITEEMEDNDDIDNLLASLEESGTGQASNNWTARKKIEDLLEERKLREQI
ncbi:MAG: hypothetical protein GTO02_18940, partial [Candidatus Dadabacteria bacterium]|nr:hypothetical protein [Candidatus Dadabacteria bacterium]